MSRRSRSLDTARRLLANHSHEHGQRHCAICLKGDRIISVGFNSYFKTHPRQAAAAARAGVPRRKYRHAEIDALERAGTRADTIVVIRLSKAGKLVNSKPCILCQKAIHDRGIRKVIHS